MSNPKTVELIFSGTIPSKKNSRINLKSGVSIPSGKFSKWQKDAITELRRQTRHRFLKPVGIEVIIYFGTVGKADIDNKVTSLLDMFVAALLLTDDQWHSVPIMKVQAEYRKNQPGAFVRIEELETDFFGDEYAAAMAKNRAKRKR